MNDTIRFSILKAPNGKSGYQETNWKGLVIGQVKDHVVLDCHRGRGDGKKWMDLRCILEIKLVGLDDDRCSGRNRGVKDDSQASDVGPFSKLGKAQGGEA